MKTKMENSLRNIGIVGWIAGAVFVACVAMANILTGNYGMVPVGFGLMATAGTYLAGATFVLRDVVDDLLGKRAVFLLIAVGAIISAFGGAGQIAVASAVAFAVGEIADYAIYRPLRKRGYVRAAVASNIVGAFVDTILFLWIAGFPIWVAVPGQMVGKLWITAAVLIAVIAVRYMIAARRDGGTDSVLREPVRS